MTSLSLGLILKKWELNCSYSEILVSYKGIETIQSRKNILTSHGKRLLFVCPVWVLNSTSVHWGGARQTGKQKIS